MFTVISTVHGLSVELHALTTQQHVSTVYWNKVWKQQSLDQPSGTRTKSLRSEQQQCAVVTHLLANHFSSNQNLFALYLNCDVHTSIERQAYVNTTFVELIVCIYIIVLSRSLSFYFRFNSNVVCLLPVYYH